MQAMQKRVARPCCVPATRSVLTTPLAATHSRSWLIRQQRWPSQLQRGLQLLPAAADHSSCSSSRAAPATHRSSSASVSVLQPLPRQQHMQQHAQETRAHAHNHRREPRRDDGSSRIIMLLALSLTLLLLPWVAHHPEFLIAPLLLACTPVVGNGVRPVLREAAAGLMTTLKLMGVAAWYDVTHEAAAHQHQHHQPSHSPAPAAVSGGKRPHNLQQQQQHQQYRTQDFQHPQQQQQQQQPAPMGPYSPWPNPARMPSNWSPPASYGGAVAAGATSSSTSSTSTSGGLSSHPLPASEDADADWSLAGPPDPHQHDPGSMQHLQAVLAADRQLGVNGGLPQAAAAAAGGGAATPSRRRSPAGSPCGSPAGSLDLGDAPLPMQQQQQQQAPHAHPPHHAAGRDPRTLSREAKQQLYHQHQQHGGPLGSGDQL